MVLFAAGLSVLLFHHGQAAAILNPNCQAWADDYCRRDCLPYIHDRCAGPLKGLFSGPKNDDNNWKCYSPDALYSATGGRRGDPTVYAGGDCYCSRQHDLINGVADCMKKEITTVFKMGMAVPGRSQKTCFRIPTALRTSQGSLLAFAEARGYNGWDPIHPCEDNGDNDIVMRRSTDGGSTWGDIVRVVAGHGLPLSNANPVQVTMTDGTKAILLHYDTRNNNHGGTSALMQTWSHDDGITWTDSTDITHFMDGQGDCMPGPSVGVQHKLSGTIYFSCHKHNAAFLYWSKDFGNTWKRSEVVTDIDECTVTLTSSSEDVLMNCKTGPGLNARMQLQWSKDGVLLDKFHSSSSPGLDDSGTQGSMLEVQGTLYLSNTYEVSMLKRQSLTLKRSNDGGHSWDDGLVIYSGASGYSQLLPPAIGADTMGVLFEFGDVHWDPSTLNHYSENGLGFYKFKIPASNPASSPKTGTRADNGSVISV